MPTNFPTGLDTFSTVVGSQTRDTPPTLSQILNNLQAAVRAIEVKLGIDSSVVTSTVDYKLAHKQPLDAELTAIAGLTSAADALPYFTGSGSAAVTTLSSFVRTVLDDVDAAAVRATIGAGTSSFNGTFGALTGTPTTLAGYGITDAQGLDATLTAFAALTIAANSLTIGTGADAFSQVSFGANKFPARSSSGDLVAKDITDFALTILDDTDAATVRATIGAGTSSFNGTFGDLTGTPTTLSGYGITDAQSLDATLTAFAALTIAANSLTIGTGADAFSQTTFAANTFPARASTGNLVAKTISDFALTILDDADGAAVRSTIGAGTGSGDMLLGSTQTNTSAKTFNDQTLKFRNPADTFSYTIVSAAIGADRSLTLPLITQTETIAIVPQKNSKANQNPTGTTSTGGVMMGLGLSITPRVTGNIFIAIDGRGENNTGDDGFSVGIRYGTGSAPTNGAALTGTLFGAMTACDCVASSSTTAIPRIPFCRIAYVTGLTVGTAYWIDLALAAVTGGTATVTAVDMFAFEL